MSSSHAVTVFGAYGHTGRFVVADLLRRGWRPILSGRDADKLAALSARHGGLDVRPASIDDPTSLDRALAGAAAVIQCAGPFGETAPAVIEAALRARIPYLDVSAEVEVVAATFAAYDARARAAGIVVMPAIAFYGGLGDLLATAAVAEWPDVDEISLAYALDSWHPTPGTRAAARASSQRRSGQRLVYTGGALTLRSDRAPTTAWTFPAPLGTQPVVAEFTTADSVTIPSHIRTGAIHTYMTTAPLKDLSDPDVPPPVATDELGRSSQKFLVEVVARRGGNERRAVAHGRDIYAVTAPIVVEATHRILAGEAGPPGLGSAGARLDARAVLQALSPAHLSLAL